MTLPTFYNAPKCTTVRVCTQMEDAQIFSSMSWMMFSHCLQFRRWPLHYHAVTYPYPSLGSNMSHITSSFLLSSNCHQLSCDLFPAWRFLFCHSSYVSNFIFRPEFLFLNSLLICNRSLSKGPLPMCSCILYGWVICYCTKFRQSIWLFYCYFIFISHGVCCVLLHGAVVCLCFIL
jgi:hypothetical protein